MKRVKSLGFATLFAVMLAFLPTALVSAAPSTVQITDVLEVNIIPADADIEISSVEGDLVTAPDYNLRLLYNGVKNIKLKVTNRNAKGEVIFEDELWTEEGDYSPDAKNFALNLDELGGYGDFTFEVTAIDYYDTVVEKSYSMKYEAPASPVVDGGRTEADPETGEVGIDVVLPKETPVSATVNIYDDNGGFVKTIEILDPEDTESIDISDLPDGTYTAEIITKDADGDELEVRTITIVKNGETSTDIDINTKADTVTTVKAEVYDDNGKLARTVIADAATGELKVYDKNGGLLFSIVNGWRVEDGELNVPLAGLEYGEYTVDITYLNKYGKAVGSVYEYTVGYYGDTTVQVPDTGDLFENANVSREDYVTFGVVILMMLAVGFMIVKRNRDRNTRMKNRKK